jgi:hypothetical protein
MLVGWTNEARGIEGMLEIWRLYEVELWRIYEVEHWTIHALEPFLLGIFTLDLDMCHLKLECCICKPTCVELDFLY